MIYYYGALHLSLMVWKKNKLKYEIKCFLTNDTNLQRFLRNVPYFFFTIFCNFRIKLDSPFLKSKIKVQVGKNNAIKFQVKDLWFMAFWASRMQVEIVMEQECGHSKNDSIFCIFFKYGSLTNLFFILSTDKLW